MKHHFVRLFLSIVLISLVVILVQCLILFIGNWYVARSWKDMVFEDFITSLRSSIGSIDDAEDSSVVSTTHLVAKGASLPYRAAKMAAVDPADYLPGT